MKKTMIALCVASLGMLTSATAATVKDGVYQGSAQGRNGDITVSVTFKAGKIKAVKVLKQSETLGISDAALKTLPEKIAKANSVAVDSVAGATLTSNGIRRAVMDAIKRAGGDAYTYSTLPIMAFKDGKDIQKSADILVVGAGGAGVSAAVRAASQGAKVLLVEKMPMIGGATILNAGTLIATGSRYQREVMKETKDSPELAAKDMMRVGKNQNDPVLVEMVTHKVGGVVDWLIDDMKIPYGPAATQYPDHSANRQLGVKGRSVNYLNLMMDRYKHFGGQIMLGVKTDKLLTDSTGRVIGVRGFDQDGNRVTVSAKATILATGGFGAYKPLLPDEMRQYVFYGLDSETGDGLKMASNVGAGITNIDLVKKYPQGVETTPGHGLAATASSTDTMKKSGAIYVNQDGKRFVNERASLGELTDATIAQPNHIAYIVMDKAAWDVYVAKSLEDKLVPNKEALQAWAKIVNHGHPVMAQGADLASVAQKMGINPQGLTVTVTDWNTMVKNGTDTAFDRPITGGLGAGPYTIVEQKVRYQTTLGGLKANAQLQILTPDGKAIPGLYGAGSVVGGANGADSMTAMMNSWAIVSGVVAADSAVKALK